MVELLLQGGRVAITTALQGGGATPKAQAVCHDQRAASRTLRGHTFWVTALAVTPDERCVISGSRDKTLKVWDPPTGQDSFTLRGHTSTVWEVAVTERRVISASRDKTLKVWDITTGQELLTLHGHTDWVRGVAVVRDFGLG